MIKILEKLLNLIYIKVCYFCGSQKDDALICTKCYSKIHFLPPSVNRKINNVNVYCVAIYDGIIKELVKALKYHGKKQLASVVADLLFKYFLSLNLDKKEFIILPVPIHKLRKRERKYNHMDLVAREFSILSKYKYNDKFILRIKDTKKQYNLKKQERILNIKDAFDIDEKYMPDKSQWLLIIDDITSTGTTLCEIIKLLKENGYENIIALTLATPDIWN